MPHRLAAAALLALAAVPAAAQGRPSSTRMTCGQAVGLVQSRGAVLLGTGDQTFDRYVRDRSFCAVTEVVQQRFVPTLDNPQCPVGYRCREPSNDDWFGDGF